MAPIRLASPRLPHRLRIPIPCCSPLRALVTLAATLAALSLVLLHDQPTRAFIHRSHWWARKKLGRPVLTLADPPHEGCAHVESEKARARENAVILVLAQEFELEQLVQSVEMMESKWNRQFGYEYLVLTDTRPFDAKFQARIRQTVTRKDEAAVTFGVIPAEHWDVPSWIPPDQLEHALQRMNGKMLYGGKLGYHKMCRWYSGLHVWHPLLRNYDYYWRLEPGIELFCDVTYDPFRYMREANKTYGFNILMRENFNTVTSLFDHVRSYANMRRIPRTSLFPLHDDLYSTKHSHEKALSEVGSRFDQYSNSRWSGCHMWNNWQIASVKFLQSKPYQDFFHYLDRTGGFFLERWGDAPVQSLGLALFLEAEQIHYFQDIGYSHSLLVHCPDPKLAGPNVGCRCQCPEGRTSVDSGGDGCLSRWAQVIGAI